MGVIRQLELSLELLKQNKEEIIKCVEDSSLSRINKDRLLVAVNRALDKEIPAKPLIIKNEIECRNCKNIVAYKDRLRPTDIYTLKHCGYCGQKIDWSK